MTEQYLGIVKAIKRTEGFAFITSGAIDPKTGELEAVDYFMHKSAMQATSPKTWDELTEAAVVLFTAIKGPKGPRAIEVRVLEGTERTERLEQERQAKERARLAATQRVVEEGDQSAVAAADVQHRRRLGLA